MLMSWSLHAFGRYLTLSLTLGPLSDDEEPGGPVTEEHAAADEITSETELAEPGDAALVRAGFRSLAET